MKELKGEEAAVAAWKATGLDVTKFWDDFAREDTSAIAAECQKAGLEFLAPSA